MEEGGRVDREINANCSSPRPAIRDIILVRFEFSPVAIRVERYANGVTSSCLSRILRVIARGLSLFAPRTCVSLSLKCDDNNAHYYPPSGGDDLSSPLIDKSSSLTLATAAQDIHERLLNGHSVSLCPLTTWPTIPLAILLTWRLGRAVRMLDVFTALKRTAADCDLEMAHSLAIPMAYARYSRMSYMPPPQFIHMRSCIVAPSRA